MEKKWIIIGLVVLTVAVAGCLDSGNGDDGVEDDGGANGGPADDSETGDGDMETVGDDIDERTAARMAACERGTTHTYEYEDPERGVQTTTVTVEGVENRDGTEFCKFRGESTEFDEEEFEDVPYFEGRTVGHMEWWITMDDWDPDDDRLDENDAIMELYDSEGRLMMSWSMIGGGFEMLFYDEDGNEIDPMEGMGIGGFEEFDDLPDDFDEEDFEDFGGF